jgi:hypothetical protein
MRGSFPLRGIFSTVSLRRRQESRFHIFMLSEAKHLSICIAEQAQRSFVGRPGNLLRMTPSKAHQHHAEE